MKTKLLSAVLLASLATGCGDRSPAFPAVTGNEGVVRFDYTGAQSGTFLAKGDAVAAGFANQAEWAFAQQSPPWTAIRASQVMEGGRQSYFDLSISLVAQPGPPYTITVTNTACVPAGCPGGIAVLEFTTGTIDTGHRYTLVQGVVNVTSVGGGRIQGTFTGTGQGQGGEGPIQIVNGRFDLPLRQEQ
jgi:hypothetical protein